MHASTKAIKLVFFAISSKRNMRTRRSNAAISSQNQISQFENRESIPHDATCVTLNFDSATACEVCSFNINNLCKVSSRKKSKFRHTSLRNRCEQRWGNIIFLV